MQPRLNSTRREQRGQPSVGESAAPSAVPLFFGNTGRPLFGWYHSAGQRTRPRHGVVICAPFGYEMMRTHRACRHLAQTLATSGVPAMRFDYDGTGDSAGSDHDLNRVDAWVASIGLAIEELKARSGVADVALVGIRFGALIAAEYARRHPVDSLVLMAPIVTGRAFVRELRATAAINTDRPLDPIDQGQEALGYHLSSATLADLQSIDLLKAAARPAAHALIIGREDLPGVEQPLVLALQQAGVAVTSSSTPVYGSMVQDHNTVVPLQLWDEIVQWIQRVPRQRHARSTSANSGKGMLARQAVFDGPDGAVRETFLSESGVFGIITRLAEDRSAQASTAWSVTPFRAVPPTILLLNIGTNHHVGSHRLYVTMAREGAALGYQVLRLDVSGIGDSAAGEVEAAGAVYSSRALDDVRRAMDVLERDHGARRFLLFGLCSGAYMAYHSAVVDPRVAGVVLVNLATFEWHPGDSLEMRQRKTFKSTQFYKRAMFDPDTWIRLVGGQVNARAVVGEIIRRLGARARSTWGRLRAQRAGTPRVNSVTENMRMLCRRGTDVLMVFGADEGGIDVMEEHLGGDASRMKKESLFRMAIIPDADHTFTGRTARTKLLELLDAHLRRPRT